MKWIIRNSEDFPSSLNPVEKIVKEEVKKLKSSYKSHIRSKEYKNGQTSNCDLCNFKCCTKRGMNRHRDENHTLEEKMNIVMKKKVPLELKIGQELYKCNKCDLRFIVKNSTDSHSSLRRAYRKHLQTQEYKNGNIANCGICREFKCCTKRGMNKHRAEDHTLEEREKYSQKNKNEIKETFSCDKCDFKWNIRKSKERAKMEHGYKTHINSQEYQNGNFLKCELCEKFKCCTMKSFRKHLKIEHKVFNLKKTLFTRHYKSGKILYKCDKCDFVPITKCKEIYPSFVKKIYERHIKSQEYENGNILNCDFCLFKCCTERDLSKHQRTEHRDLIPKKKYEYIPKKKYDEIKEIYECDRCDVKWIVRNYEEKPDMVIAYKSHLKTQEYRNRYLYNCGQSGDRQCEFKSCTKRGLMKHIKLEHVGEKSVKSDETGSLFVTVDLTKPTEKSQTDDIVTIDDMTESQRVTDNDDQGRKKSRKQQLHNRSNSKLEENISNWGFGTKSKKNKRIEKKRIDHSKRYVF